MKNIIVFFLIILLAASCNKNLDKDPIGQPSNTTFYATQQEILMAVNAAYPYLGMKPTTAANVFPNVPYIFLTDYVTDIMATRHTVNHYVAFKTGSLNSSSALSSFWWTSCYEGINRTNALINNMSRAEAVSDATIFRRVKAEARVIRAVMYIYLLQNFGDVPLVTEVLTPEQAVAVTRQAKSEILQFIYSEIDASVADLPTTYTGVDKGRITKGCAYAMKARVALYNNDWAIAKAAAKACMDLNVYKLYPSYKELFMLKANNNNDEVILYDQYKTPEKTHSYHQFNGTRNAAGQAQSFPTEDFIAGVECTDGKLITQSSLYDPTNPFVNRDPRLAMAVLLPRVWDGTTIKTNGGRFNGIEYMSSKEKLYQAGSTTAILSTSLYEKERVLPSGAANQDATNDFASFTGYVVNKYLDSLNVSIASTNYNNIILCRYPEVLLTYAEACIELNTIDQTVLDAINMARARAYGNTSAAGVTNLNATNYPKITTMNQSELRKVVRRERKVELCFEGFRLQDLRRWGIMVKALNMRINYGRSDNFTKLAATDLPVFDADELVTFPYATQRYGLNNEQTKLRWFETFGAITSAYNLLPIPIGEIQLNSKLAQNPGYN